MTDDNHFLINWIVDGIEFKGAKSAPLNIAVCGRSKNICKVVQDYATPLFVKDLYIDPKSNRCEEGERCLDSTCPLNKTTFKTWNRGRSPHLTETEFANLIELCVKWTEAFQKDIDAWKWDGPVITQFEGACLVYTKREKTTTGGN